MSVPKIALLSAAFLSATPSFEPGRRAYTKPPPEYWAQWGRQEPQDKDARRRAAQKRQKEARRRQRRK